jgi:hypothetical protein
LHIPDTPDRPSLLPCSPLPFLDIHRFDFSGTRDLDLSPLISLYGGLFPTLSLPLSTPLPPFLLLLVLILLPKKRRIKNPNNNLFKKSRI